VNEFENSQKKRKIKNWFKKLIFRKNFNKLNFKSIVTVLFFLLLIIKIIIKK